ncbi:LysR family transcriptional regulator [Nocardia arizonensis]|uniref:LysR family transcriptional regulator n=1 Tax=Nocardia arizonensis TaxID=1141647 RepID=UPI0006CF4550|nr:LysR family transcriptional regulator [Nocardia arizonensis]
MPLPPGMPDLAVLDLLVSVSELGSLGAAARRHGITQPAASMRITALERQLRLRLVERGPTGSTLTEAGRAVVAQALPVLAAAAAFGAGVAAVHSAEVPRLRIAASKTIADHRIPQWLTALRQTCPDVAVALDVDNTRQVEALVRDGTAEIGFVEGPHPPPGLGNRVIGADELVVVVAPGHPWADRDEPLSLRELATTPLLWREPGSGTRDTIWEILVAECQPARPAAELGSAAAIVAAARAGVAPAVLSRLIAGADIARGALRAVRSAESITLTRRFRAIWRPANPPSGAGRILTEHAVSIERYREDKW